MAQSLELNIKTTSEVPQAMEKAKQATSSFDKQIEGIGKKFTNSFKDIFLSFLGPMALLTGAIALVAKMIAENQKKQEEANQAAIDGTNELMSAEDRYWANKQKNEKKGKVDAEQAKVQREQVTFEFLQKDPRGWQIYKDYLEYKIGEKTNAYNNRKYNVRYDKEVQDKVQALIAEDEKSTNGKNAQTGAKTSFKSPEGFGNIVGVGPNPVMEAMTAQLEEAKKQTILLESLNNKTPGGGVPTDFTKSTSTSRATLLKGGN